MAQENLPVTPEEVCSRAMVMCGMEAMSSFSELGRDEVIVASQLYEVMVNAALSSYPWRFASGQWQLELSASDPLDRYESAWHYPTLPEGRPLQIQQIRSGDDPVRYDIFKNLIYASADPSAVLIADYQFRVEEAYWLPQFMLFMIFDLAATFASSVTRSSTQLKAFDGMAERQLMRAKTRDAQSKTPKRSRMTALRRPRHEWPRGSTTV